MTVFFMAPQDPEYKFYHSYSSDGLVFSQGNIPDLCIESGCFRIIHYEFPLTGKIRDLDNDYNDYCDFCGDCTYAATWVI